MSTHGIPQHYLKRRRTKIVATVGPASNSPERLAQLIAAGVNVFRLNFSHGTHEEHRVAFERIRAAAEASGEPVAVLADLCGPKIRTGEFAGGGIHLVADQPVTVTTRDVVGHQELIPTQYPALARDVRPGDRILLDDGLIELRVLQADGDDIACRVVVGGQLRNRKGINLPGVAVSSPALTEKDREDAAFALDLGVDFLALSFVRRPEDIADLRRLIADRQANTPIIAKIEKPEALAPIDAIIDAADGIMVARGDLGVEMPAEAVPIVQRDLVSRARHRGKPVIVATQMLESMVNNPRPTRAEVSDGSGAVFAGADAVMLSAETAVGQYPLEAVAVMDRVAREVEAWHWAEGAFHSITGDDPSAPPPLPLRQAVCRSTAQLSRDLRVRAVIVRTAHGGTARAVAATRPAAPILALTTRAYECRRLNLLWGVVPLCVTAEQFDCPRETGWQVAHDLGLIVEGEYLLLVAGFGRNMPTVTVLPTNAPPNRR